MQPSPGAPTYAPDPTWKIPRAAGTYDSVFEWWQHIADVDEQIYSRGFNAEAVEDVLFRVEQLRIDMCVVGPNPGRVTRVREHVTVLMRDYGFTVDQLLAALGMHGFVPTTILSMLCPAGSRADDKAKVTAIELLRDGVPLEEIEARTGLTAKHQLPDLANRLGIEYRTAGKAPPSVRARALELLADGLTAPQVVGALAAEGETVSTEQVRKWRQRAVAV